MYTDIGKKKDFVKNGRSQMYVGRERERDVLSQDGIRAV